MDREPELTIVPLTLEHWDPLARLFAEGGDPRWCWCMYWRRSAAESRTATVAEQREGLRGLATGPRAPGLVALREDRAVGSVSLGPREDFPRVVRSRVLPRVDEEPVWVIVCFVVSRTARGQGLAAALLDAAVSWARREGAPAVEAYPVAVEEGELVDPRSLYTGTLPTFLRAGFEQIADTTSTSGGRPRVVVRLRLRPGAEGSTRALTSRIARA